MKNNRKISVITSTILCLLMLVNLIPINAFAKTYKTGDVFTSGKLAYTVLDNKSVECSGFATYKQKGKTKTYKVKKLIIPASVKGYNVTKVRGFNTQNEGLPKTTRYDCIESIEIPNKVTNIYDSFYGCKNLKKVKLGKNVKCINTKAFNKTPFKKSHTKNGVFSVGKFLISVDSSVTNLKIKDGIYIIADEAFPTKKLEKIKFSKTVKYFGKIEDNGRLLDKPSNTIDLQTQFAKKGYKKIKAINVAKNNKHFSSKNGVLYNKNLSELIMYPSGKENKAFNLLSTVKKLNKYSICSAKNLEYVKLNEKLEKIDNMSLYDLNNLKALTIPKSVNYIAQGSVGYVYNKDGLLPSKTRFAVYKDSVGEKYMQNGYNNSLTGNAKLNWSYICDSHSFETINDKSSDYFVYGHSKYLQCKKCGEIKNYNDINKKVLATPKFTLKGAKSSLKIKYKKISNDASGFQVKYTKGNKDYTKTFNTSKSATKTIKKLSKGKYKVKIRAYVQKDEKKAYSPWSKSKTVTIK